jgi:hypothetical protein
LKILKEETHFEEKKNNYGKLFEQLWCCGLKEEYTLEYQKKKICKWKKATPCSKPQQNMVNLLHRALINNNNFYGNYSLIPITFDPIRPKIRCCLDYRILQMHCSRIS